MDSFSIFQDKIYYTKDYRHKKFHILTGIVSGR